MISSRKIFNQHENIFSKGCCYLQFDWVIIYFNRPTGRCESIRIPMCRNMPYSSAQFPNLLNHQSQDDAIALANVLGPLVKSGCSSSIEHFLCSVLAPPCGGTQQPMPPCKGLCKRATRSCRDLLNKFQITLDPSMRCKNLPKEGTSKCFNGSWPRGTNTPSPG